VLFRPNRSHGSYSYSDSYSDGEGRNTYAHATAVSNALNQVTTAVYDYDTGKMTAQVDPNGVTTAWSYNDPLNRLMLLRRAAGAGSGVESQTNYSYPNTRTVVVAQDQNTTGDQALRSQTQYDGLGRPIESDTFESSSQYIASTQSSDALGRVVVTTNPSRYRMERATGWAMSPITATMR
jgi:hypothetical protein